LRSSEFHTPRRGGEDGELITHSLMLVTSLSSIMLQVCSVIIISPMIRGSRLTAHVVIVSKATSALASSGIVHRHLEWKLTAKKRRFVRTTATLRGERRFHEKVTLRQGENPTREIDRSTIAIANDGGRSNCSTRSGLTL